MALEIFKLVGSIFVDSEAADKSLSKTDEKAGGVGQKLADGIKTAGKWGAAIVGGATAAVTAVTAFATKTASAADEIDKMSQKIGISREAYQELDFILSQNGMDVNSLQGGMKTLVNTMQSAQAGTESAMTTFDSLGVSIMDSSGALRSQEDVFYDAIAALQGMENETERNALANDLFGRSASELAPLLNSGAGSMEELRQKAHDLGLVLDDEVIDSGVALTDTVDQLKRSFSAVAINLGGAVMPLVQEVADWLIGFMPQIQNLFTQLTPVITSLFTELVPPLMDLAQSIFPALIQVITTVIPIVTQIIEAILPVVVELLDMLLPPFVQIVETLLPPLLELLQPILDLLDPLIQLLQPILDLVVAILEPLSELISDLLTPLISLVTRVIGVALVPLQGAFSDLSGLLSDTVNAAIEGVMNLVDKMKGVFSGLINFITGVFTGGWSKAWESVKSIFASVFEGIKSAFAAPINWIISGINSFIRGINRIKIPSWVPGVGGLGFSISEIPALAKGGVLEKGQTGYLEGTGAEAVVPLENNRHWIHSVAEDMKAAGIGGDDRTINLLTAILDALEDLLRAGIYLDGKKLVGALAGHLDRELGARAAKKARA